MTRNGSFFNLYNHDFVRIAVGVPSVRVADPAYNADQTIASRAAIEAFLKKTGAQLWIQHDITANAKLKKSPQYYE